MEKILIQFIPIILLVIVLLYPKTSHSFITSFLGKLVAIIIIMFYASIDKLYGAFACAVIITYYQTSNIEGMDTYCAPYVPPPKKNEVIMQDEREGWQYANSDLQDSNLGDPSKEEHCHIEGMEGIEQDSSRTAFQNKHCVGGKLKYKGLTVNNEMAEHVFPELKFTNGTCNPCDNTCSYVINSKLEVERDIVTPKESKDIPPSMWNRFNPFAHPPVDSIGVVSEPFSFLEQ
jgi:hypothetical protein